MPTIVPQAIRHQSAFQEDAILLANRRHHHGRTSSGWSSSLTEKDYCIIQAKPKTISAARDNVSAAS